MKTIGKVQWMGATGTEHIPVTPPLSLPAKPANAAVPRGLDAAAVAGITGASPMPRPGKLAI